MQIGIAMRKPSGLTLPQRIRQLFAAGEQGVWYDPSDFSTMFQDSAGTTPITAVEQPVGLILDKSKGLVLGAELVTNGGFDSDTSWTPTNIGTGYAGYPKIVSGYALSRRDAGDNQSFYVQQITTVIGKTYAVSTTAYAIAGIGNLQIINLALSTFFQSPITSATPVKATLVFTADETAYLIRLPVVLNSECAFDNISVKELPVQHSKQATSAARPLLKASPTRIDYDAVDDTLVATFASSLGTDCTVCRAVPSVGASILTAQTIGTTYTDNTDHCGLIIVNRALTASETASVTAYLNAKAGV